MLPASPATVSALEPSDLASLVGIALLPSPAAFPSADIVAPASAGAASLEEQPGGTSQATSSHAENRRIRDLRQSVSLRRRPGPVSRG